MSLVISKLLYCDQFSSLVPPQVSIVWPDQHTSVFDADWLKKRCFSPAARQALQEELFLNGKLVFNFLLFLNVFNVFNGIMNCNQLVPATVVCVCTYVR